MKAVKKKQSTTQQRKLKNLKVVRIKRDYTRTMLSKASGVSPTYLYLIERKGYAPRPAIVQKLAKALKTRPTTLY